MFGDIEQLVLSGALFSDSRSSSPERSPSPDNSSKWPPSPHFSDDDEFDKDEGKRIGIDQDAHTQSSSIGMGPGRTGVKGVIRDQAEAAERYRQRRIRELQERNEKLEQQALIAMTYQEEEEEKRMANGDLTDNRPTKQFHRIGRFGHLREVGRKGFVQAVEGEDRGTWVIVHLYDPSLERCARLDSTLLHIARTHSQTKFMRVKATAVGFASLDRQKPRSLLDSNLLSRPIQEYEEEDENDDWEDDEVELEEDVDLDVLPTLLAYRDGELVHTWVRVDWEVQSMDEIEGLLSKVHIIEPKPTTIFSEDDDDDDDGL